MLGQFGAGQPAHDAAVEKHRNPIAAANEFGIVCGIEHDRSARVGELAQQCVDLLLGADIDAPGRIAEQQDARRIHQPFADDHLLLVSTRQRTHRHAHVRHLDRQPSHHVRNGFVLHCRRDNASAAQAIKCGEAEVVVDRHRQHQPVGLPVLGHQCDAQFGTLGMPRTADIDLPAIQHDVATQAAQHAEQGQEHLALPLSIQPAEPYDFARPHGDIDVVQPTVPRQASHVECRRAGRVARRWLGWKSMRDIAPDHHLHGLGVALRAGQKGRHVAAVAKHGAVVGQLFDLVHPVRDIDDRHALTSQAFEQRKYTGHIRRSQRRRGFIKDQNPGLTRQGFRDLDHLPTRQRQTFHRRERMDVFGTRTRQCRLGNATLRLAIDQAEAGRWIRDADVVGHAQIGHERQLLKDAGDTGAHRLLRMREPTFHASEHDAAFVGLDDARHDLDQCRLARAVFTEQCMDAPGRHGEVGMLERTHAAVALGHLYQLKNRFHSGECATCTSCSSRPWT